MAASCSSTCTSINQLQEITGCGNSQAVKLLQLAKGDVAVAVDMFFDQEGLVVIDVNENLSDCIELIGEADKKKLKVSRTIVIEDEADDEKHSNAEMRSAVLGQIAECTEEEILKTAIDASTNQYLQDEPDPETNFRILSSIFPHLDQTALRNLCLKFKDRSTDLEKFVETRINEIPSKLEGEKIKLQAKINEFINAGVEDATKMSVEDCPSCKVSKIVEDPTAKVFICIECKGEFCSKCKEVQHIPFKCSIKNNQIFDGVDQFKIINVLPKRSYDESDPLEKEYRIAESQFMRMNITNKKNYRIKSIDIVFNKELQLKFDKKQAELTFQGNGECLLLFHGTPQKNIIPILKSNFDLSITTNGRAYGDGVYFSECPEVSIGYSQDQKSLILCKVLRGTNSKEVMKGDAGGRCWAVVVPGVDQILPKYVINFM